MLRFFYKIAVICAKKRQFFRQFFRRFLWRKYILQIITSTPDHFVTAGRYLRSALAAELPRLPALSLVLQRGRAAHGEHPQAEAGVSVRRGRFNETLSDKIYG
jgi:hypothetical protein